MNEWEIICAIARSGRPVLIYRLNDVDFAEDGDAGKPIPADAQIQLYAIVRDHNGGESFPATVSGLSEALEAEPTVPTIDGIPRLQMPLRSRYGAGR